MATPNVAIQGLSPFTFRGLDPVPCKTIGNNGGHDQPEYTYPYIDVGTHDHTGRKPTRFSVVLCFINGLDGSRPLFPEVWNEYYEAISDGSSGPCWHPLFGPMRARVLDWDVPLDASTTAGVFATVNFTETRDDIEQDLEFYRTSAAVSTLASAAQDAANEYEINYPSGDPAQPSLLDTIAQLESLAFEASLTYAGFANKVAGNVAKMIDAAKALNDPSAWPATELLTQLWDRLKSAAKQAAKTANPRPKRSAKAITDTTLDAFARSVNNTLSDVAELNPEALGKPVVSKGSVLFYYA
jgi:hypothetical protein